MSNQLGSFVKLHALFMVHESPGCLNKVIIWFVTPGSYMLSHNDAKEVVRVRIVSRMAG